jgi:hypothetical protein
MVKLKERKCKLCDALKKFPVKRRGDAFMSAFYVNGFVDGLQVIIKSTRSRLCPKHERWLVSIVEEHLGVKMVELSGPLKTEPSLQ